jgi:hypothetical protein
VLFRRKRRQAVTELGIDHDRHGVSSFDVFHCVSDLTPRVQLRAIVLSS